jgi:hypothetical protein
MAYIKSLQEMEKIVSQNKSLYWDGWTVISSFPSDKGRTSKYGAYVKGKWHLQKRFVLTRDGWDIPDRFAGDHGQKRMEG